MKYDKESNFSMTIKNKKFNRTVRFVKGDVERVEWRRSKTGHEVKKDEFLFLENEFSKKILEKPKNSTIQDYYNISTSPYIIKKVFDIVKDREYLLNVINKHIQDGEILMATKKIKDLTGLRLRESKDFVDLCRDICRLKEKHIPHLDNKLRISIENGLIKESDNGANLLKGVKYVKEQTGWGLRESKDFVDYFFKIKQNFNK